MRWADERYVRVYTRDTGEWLALGWEAQALFLFALRKADRAGIVRTGKAGVRGLAGMTGMPLDVVSRVLPLLVEDGCLRETDGGYIIPNFIEAQEVPISDAQRKRDQRERDRDKALASGGVRHPIRRAAGPVGPNHPSIVYFLQNPATNEIKIGVTINLPRRKAEIERDEMTALNLLATMPGDWALEQQIHFRFDSFRIRREWFSPAPPILEFISQIRTEAR